MKALLAIPLYRTKKKSNQMSIVSAIGVFFTLMLTACTSAKPQEKEYFVLQPSSKTHVTMISGKPSISIRRVKLPTYLNQPGIVRHIDNGKITVSFIDHWAERLSHAIPNLLALELEANLKKPIEVHPLPPGIRVDTIVEVTISQFIGNAQELSLTASYRLIQPKKLHRYRFHTTVNLANSTTSALTRGYSKAIKILADEIATHL